MNRTASSRIGLLVLGLLLAQVALPSLTEAGHSISKKAHWEHRETPFTLLVGDNVDAKWNQALDRAAGEWSRSRVLNLKVVRGTTNPRQCRPKQGRVEACSENYGDNGWLGVTVFWFKDRHIKQAIVAVNDFYFENPNFSELDNPIARRYVLCHELGHALGLDHRRGKSCLNHRGRISAGTANPDRHDFEQLERIYRHVDDGGLTSAAVDAGPSTAVPSEPYLPTNLRGQPPVVVHDLGGGWQRVTIINWLP